MEFSAKALQLIVEFEGINQPGKWPGGKSGITLGYGYDLGHVGHDEFDADWAGCFTPGQFARLHAAIGETGPAAAALAAGLADVRCTGADSRRVLLDVSIPEYVDRTGRAFPGLDDLPLDAQGALVSLVYNRGAGMKDDPGKDNRREMRAIRDCVARGDLAGVAAQLRSMKRLWVGAGMGGLLRRRDAEAALVESCLEPALEALEAARALRGRAGAKQVPRKVPRKKVVGRRKAWAKSKGPARKAAAKKTRKSPPRSRARKPRAKRPTAKKQAARRHGRLR